MALHTIIDAVAIAISVRVQQDGVFSDWIRAFSSIEASDDQTQPVVLGSVDHWDDNGGLDLCAWERLVREVAPPEMCCLNGTAQGCLPRFDKMALLWYPIP